MDTLNLKPNHKAVKEYYETVSNLSELGAEHEGAVSPSFATLLRHCARQFEWTLVEQYSIKRNGYPIRVDGAIVDAFNLVHGYWEAKDTSDDLGKEIKKKFAAGYPRDNILFQAPDHIIVWQDAREVFNEDISQTEKLIEGLKIFFEYQPPAYEQWEKAIEEFKLRVPELGTGLLQLIEKERQTNQRFIQAFESFSNLCRQTINPNISTQAIEEMLIQHVLTERIFRKVFNNPDFVERNAIAHEIEKVISALTSQSFSRHDFLKSLDRFYVAIETTAATIDDFSQKQGFLNTVYEQFFQGFSVKVADIYGIVYTPQPIVNFMVRSVEEILKREFNRSLSDEGVHILDPFVGTGSFIVRIMREMQRSRLPYKYTNELHCNEVMLLPYYIASMNIEHEYYEQVGKYEPFEGVCLVDTFELAEGKQLPLFTEENTARVKRQQNSPIFVIIGNPPYNAKQVNENDKNKNRKYDALDKRVSNTYARDSKATLMNQLGDPYVKAICFASDRIGDEGIVAFVTNNSFIDGIAFDGMRKHLAQEFSKIYHVNLKGNARTSGEQRRREAGNIFDDLIRVSIGITFLVKTRVRKAQAEIYIYSIDDYLKSEEKRKILEDSQSHSNLPMKQIVPDKNYTWLTEGLSAGFETLLLMGDKENKRTASVQAIFRTFSNGVKSNNDAYIYSFDSKLLYTNAQKMIEAYSATLDKWKRKGQPRNLDNVLNVDEKTLKWIRHTKRSLLRGLDVDFGNTKIREAHYRPFCIQQYYFERIFNEDTYQFPHIFPTPNTEYENRLICVPSAGSKQIAFFMTRLITDVNFFAGSTPIQCFPFYAYNEDGSNRKENITDWALEQFRKQYNDKKISKWDIFHYVYAMLHHPQYREKYTANLKRELPRIPFAPDFRSYAKAGAKLAELHVKYEEQAEYSLKRIENKDVPLNWRVEKMKLSKDKAQLIYNNFLTLAGIPAEAFEYKLGNRSALEWVIDQYQVKTDKRSGIVNDPNQLDDPEYIVRLIGKVIKVSLETMRVVKGLPADIGA